MTWGVTVVAPDGQRAALETAVIEGGGTVVALGESTRGLVASVGPDEVAALIRATPGLEWVQLGAAGVDSYAAAGLFTPALTWLSAKGAYAQPVAEHALALALALLRQFSVRARASAWGSQAGISLHGLSVVMVGGGGIAAEVMRLLGPFDVRVTVVRSQDVPLEGADSTVTFDRLDRVLPEADVVIVACALTEQTRDLFDAERLAILRRGAILINVARGAVVSTDALVAALETGQLAGAGLDVTEPEPLPEGHPLWRMDSVLLTPHTADTPEMIRVMLSARVKANVALWRAGESFVGVVNPTRGY